MEEEDTEDPVRTATEKIDEKIETLEKQKEKIQNKQENVENALGDSADIYYKLKEPSDHVGDVYRVVINITCDRVPPLIQDMTKSNSQGSIDVMGDRIQVWLSYTIEEL